MKWQFIYAHPDDETVAAGGTIRLLADLGHEVVVTIVTPGDAGEVHSNSLKNLKEAGSLVALRSIELKKACDVLGISRFNILDYKDGEITNKLVWSGLTSALLDEIEQEKPDFVVTFDHGGWYFHLDHVGVSLATLRAVQRSSHEMSGLFFSLFHPPGIRTKWDYVYPDSLLSTHEVDISSVVEFKVKALKAHASQNIGLVEKLQNGLMNTEYFQLVRSSEKGAKEIGSIEFFKSIT